MDEETDFDRFVRFSRAIAKNIPTEDGEELGDLLIEKHEDDNVGLITELINWLIAVGFSKDDSIDIIKAAITHSTRLIFKTKPTDEELQA